jgi:hypothetical protein
LRSDEEHEKNEDTTMVLGVIDTAKPSSKFFGNQGNCPIRVPDFVNYYLLKLGGSVETLELLPWRKSTE